MNPKMQSPYTVENFKLKDDTIVFRDIRKEPFEIFGFYDVENRNDYIRVPNEVAEKCQAAPGEPSLYTRYRRTSGGRIRFKTDSDCLAIRVKLPNLTPYPFATPIMNYGFDFYIRKNGKEVLGGIFNPPSDVVDEYDGCVNLRDRSEKEITINFPLFNEVSSVEIGLRQGASLDRHTPYTIQKPVVFYGSSITHGMSASRPGLSYENILSRKFDMNYTNLGFGGSCKAEQAIVDYIAGLEMSAFVCDYDHNAPNPEYLLETHKNVYETVRTAQPDLPIILVTKPDFHFERFDEARRRAIIMDTYSYGIKNGDKNLYFVDGAAFFAGTERCDCTMENCHPNDLGLSLMAKNIGDTLAYVLKV